MLTFSEGTEWLFIFLQHLRSFAEDLSTDSLGIFTFGLKDRSSCEIFTVFLMLDCL